jgi:hypothetical protein
VLIGSASSFLAWVEAQNTGTRILATYLLRRFKSNGDIALASPSTKVGKDKETDNSTASGMQQQYTANVEADPTLNRRYCRG